MVAEEDHCTNKEKKSDRAFGSSTYESTRGKYWSESPTPRPSKAKNTKGKKRTTWCLPFLATL